jgi:DNA repair protein RadC
MGVAGASTLDLLAVGFARSEADANVGETVGRRLMERYQTLRMLGEAAPAELGELTGMDSFEVLRVQTLMELGRRFHVAGTGPGTMIEDPGDVVEEIVGQLAKLRGAKKEHFYAILLDSKGKILRLAEVHIGTLTMSLVGPREVFREAIRDGASSIILAHNHPSGDPSPSPEDLEVTRRLVDLGDLLDIPVLDHVIVGEGKRFTSLRRKNLM